MRLLLLLLLVGCQTTNYVAPNDRISFGGVPEGYRVSRQIETSWWEHFFVIGLISGRDQTDLMAKISLNDGERCFNTRLQNEIPGGYILLQLLAQGLLPIIWSARSTELRCDVGVKVAAPEPAPVPVASPSPTP